MVKKWGFLLLMSALLCAHALSASNLFNALPTDDEFDTGIKSARNRVSDWTYRHLGIGQPPVTTQAAEFGQQLQQNLDDAAIAAQVAFDEAADGASSIGSSTWNGIKAVGQSISEGARRVQLWIKEKLGILTIEEKIKDEIRKADREPDSATKAELLKIAAEEIQTVKESVKAMRKTVISGLAHTSENYAQGLTGSQEDFGFDATTTPEAVETLESLATNVHKKRMVADPTYAREIKASSSGFAERTAARIGLGAVQTPQEIRDAQVQKEREARKQQDQAQQDQARKEERAKRKTNQAAQRDEIRTKYGLGER